MATQRSHTAPPGLNGHPSSDTAHGQRNAGVPVAADPASAVTPAQLATVAILTVLALVASVVFAASRANLRLSAHDVGGLVMPPGMLMGRETSAESMRDMAAVDLRRIAFAAPPDARGDLPPQPRLEDGVKVFRLEAEPIRWHILPGVQVAAYGFNRQVPGPRLRVTEGDRIRIEVSNRLPEATSVHWHGLILPNGMDGASEITQQPIPPGGRFTYEFVARQPGTFFYHSHHHVDRQQTLGLYGALIVDPADSGNRPAYDQELVVQLQEWTHKEGYTFPAMPMEGALPNYFTINGKAYPATETVHLKVGERLLVRFVGSQGSFVHPMHIHGGPFTIVETDGYPVPEGARLLKDTVNVGPGERWDVVWEAREPGKWLVHCHINHHTTNDNREEHGGGGLMLVINVG